MIALEGIIYVYALFSQLVFVRTNETAREKARNIANVILLHLLSLIEAYVI